MRDAVKEGTEVNRAGFTQLNEITRAGLSEVAQVTQTGFGRLEARQVQGNAISSAVAKAQGIDVTSASPMRMGKWLQEVGADIEGTLTFQSAAQIEAKKLGGGK